MELHKGASGPVHCAVLGILMGVRGQWSAKKRRMKLEAHEIKRDNPLSPVPEFILVRLLVSVCPGTVAQEERAGAP